MKNKSNILIIIVVTMLALTVIALVIVTGYSKSSLNHAGNGSSEPDTLSVDSSGQGEGGVSEPPAASEQSFVTEVSEPSDDSVPDDNVSQKIVALASALIGVPFAENGSTPSGFDNSGFIYYVLRENGYITCPRTTDAQSRMGEYVGRDSLKPGDLVFFGLDGSGNADFGGIYIGDGTMIASLMPDTNVREVDITTDYYVSHFYGGISLS